MTRARAPQRMMRLLALVPWIAANGGPRIDEVCARFDLTREQLLRDLDIASFVGLAPYTADELIELTYDDDRVWVHYPRMFTRPLRLTPEEGLALVVAGSAALALPGADRHGPLATAVTKLAAVLDVDPDRLEVDLGDAPAGAFGTLERAIRERRAVEIEYYSFGRNETTKRVVEPWRIWSDQGNWYLSAYCRTANGERLFRLDRINEISLLDERFESVPAGPATSLFSATPDTPRVTLDVAPGARWVLENHPVETAEVLPNGHVRVVLAVAAAPWLERLLLTLGDDATVVEIDPRLGGADLAARAAARILANYGDAIASLDRD